MPGVGAYAASRYLIHGVSLLGAVAWGENLVEPEGEPVEHMRPLDRLRGCLVRRRRGYLDDERPQVDLLLPRFVAGLAQLGDGGRVPGGAVDEGAGEQEVGAGEGEGEQDQEHDGVPGAPGHGRLTRRRHHLPPVARTQMARTQRTAMTARSHRLRAHPGGFSRGPRRWAR